MNEIPLHHIKEDVCLTRPRYRDSKKPKVVKVNIYYYSIQ